MYIPSQPACKGICRSTMVKGGPRRLRFKISVNVNPAEAHFKCYKLDRAKVGLLPRETSARLMTSGMIGGTFEWHDVWIR